MDLSGPEAKVTCWTEVRIVNQCQQSSHLVHCSCHHQHKHMSGINCQGWCNALHTEVPFLTCLDSCIDTKQGYLASPNMRLQPGMHQHTLRAWLQLEGVQPLASPDDCLLAEQIAKADPKVREMLKMRGVTDMDLVACDPWSGMHCLHPRAGPIWPLSFRPCLRALPDCLSDCLSVRPSLTAVVTIVKSDV